MKSTLIIWKSEGAGIHHQIFKGTGGEEKRFVLWHHGYIRGKREGRVQDIMGWPDTRRFPGLESQMVVKLVVSNLLHKTFEKKLQDVPRVLVEIPVSVACFNPFI